MNPEEKVIDILKGFGFDYAEVLPCDRVKNLLALIGSSFREIRLTREEEGIGIAAGIYLGGKKSFMCIQSTGLGNSFNALMSLTRGYGLPLPIIASWRGGSDEPIEAQKAFGEKIEKALAAFGIEHAEIKDAADVDRMQDLFSHSLSEGAPAVALFTPSVWKKSSLSIPLAERRFGVKMESRERKSRLDFSSEIKPAELTNRDAIEILTQSRADAAVISNIGHPSMMLYMTGDSERNFYMLGSLGLASSIGTGLALARPDLEVIVIDGDGSLLMNPNALVTAGLLAPENLTIVCLDNSAYGSTGHQLTATAAKVDLQLLARCLGFGDARRAHSREELSDALAERTGGLNFIHVLTNPEEKKLQGIPYSMIEIRERFQSAISAT